MTKSPLKNIFTYLLLVFFIAIKIAGIHTFFHHDNNDEKEEICVVCDYAIENNFTPTIATDTKEVQIATFTFYVPKNPIGIFNKVLIATHYFRVLFSRPPPVMA